MNYQSRLIGFVQDEAPHAKVAQVAEVHEVAEANEFNEQDFDALWDWWLVFRGRPMYVQ